MLDAGLLPEHVYAVPIGRRWLVHAPLVGVTALVNAAALSRIARGGDLPGELSDALRAPAWPPPPPRADGVPPFLGLVVTRSCNLACRYCGFGATANGANMSPALAEAAVLWQAERAAQSGSGELSLHFFGGEPLVAADTVARAVQVAERAARDRGLVPHFEISTNGVCSPRLRDYLAAHFHSVVLSLDGPAELHDKQRPTRAGGPSYAAVAATARAIADSAAELSIRCCVTQDSLAGLEELADWLAAEFQPESLNLEPVQPCATRPLDGVAPPDPWEFAVRYARASARLRARGVRSIYSALAGEAPRLSACPLGTGAPIIDPAGRVSACYLEPAEWRAFGLDLGIGEFDGGALRLRPEAPSAIHRLLLDKPRCRGCFARYRCAGGCHVYHSRPEGEGGYGSYCVQTRIIVACALLDELGCGDEVGSLLGDDAALRALAEQERDDGGHPGTALAQRPLELPPWVIPYVDQPTEFWEAIGECHGRRVSTVYFPLGLPGLGSGRPALPASHLREFLQVDGFRHSALVNPIELPAPAAELAPRLLEALRRLDGEFGLDEVTLASVELARRLRDGWPELSLTASVLLDVASVEDLERVGDVFDVLVPSHRIVRDRAALRRLKCAFRGRLRLLVNEGCVGDCPDRKAHFRDMARAGPAPASLCETRLERTPWLRWTGAWVLPQHLHLVADLCDEFKLAGRATLQSAPDYRSVLDAYVRAEPLPASEIGAGPAGVLEARNYPEWLYRHTLECGRVCGECDVCSAFATGKVP